MGNFIDVFLNVSLVLMIYVVVIILFNIWNKQKFIKQGTSQIDKIKELLKVDDYVIFSGGIKGKVVSINDIWVTVEVYDGTRIEILLNSIMNILTDKD